MIKNDVIHLPKELRGYENYIVHVVITVEITDDNETNKKSFTILKRNGEYKNIS